MAIVIEDFDTATEASQQLSFTLPGGAPDDGDLLLLLAQSGQFASREVDPATSGWTELTDFEPAYSNSVQIFYRVASGDGATHTFDLTSEFTDSVGLLMRLSGAAEPSGWTVQTDEGSDTTSINSPAFTVGDDGSRVFRWVLFDYSFHDLGGAPSGYTRLADVASNEFTAGCFVLDYGAADTGTSAAESYSSTGGNLWSAVTFAIAPAAGGGGVTGDISQTLPALSQSAAATTRHEAVTAQTLPALTQSAAATTRHEAAVAQSLPALTQSGAATTKHEAAVAQTLPALTQAATAGNGELTAAITQTLPALTQSVAATNKHQAAATQTLPALTQAASATTKHAAAVTQSLPALTQAATATLGDEAEGVTAAVAQTLPAMMQAATCTTKHQAAIAQMLPALTQAAMVGELILGDVPVLSIRRPITVHSVRRPITVLSVPVD